MQHVALRTTLLPPEPRAQPRRGRAPAAAARGTAASTATPPPARTPEGASHLRRGLRTGHSLAHRTELRRETAPLLFPVPKLRPAAVSQGGARTLARHGHAPRSAARRPRPRSAGPPPRSPRRSGRARRPRRPGRTPRATSRQQSTFKNTGYTHKNHSAQKQKRKIVHNSENNTCLFELKTNNW